MIVTLLACTSSVPERPERSDAASRIDAGTPEVAVPDCELLTRCPEVGLDPARCVDDPEWFTVTLLDGMVGTIELDPAAEVPEGEWFTAFPDPDGGCDLTLFSFRAPR